MQINYNHDWRSSRRQDYDDFVVCALCNVQCIGGGVVQRGNTGSIIVWSRCFRISFSLLCFWPKHLQLILYSFNAFLRQIKQTNGFIVKYLLVWVSKQNKKKVVYNQILMAKTTDTISIEFVFVCLFFSLLLLSNNVWHGNG